MRPDTSERELSWLAGDQRRIARVRRRLQLPDDARAHLLDATMLYAPNSGGVKRYLQAKGAWLARTRLQVRRTLLVPGAKTAAGPDGVVTLSAAKLPFGDGYRWPANMTKWSTWISEMKPDLIEAGDPYTPGQAALDAGQRLGVPVIGFCHSDPAALAALHMGEWVKKPIEKRWARLFSEFDRVVAPSRFIAQRLAEAGVADVVCRPLGVDVEAFRPDRRDPAWLRRRLDLPAEARILVFAGRPAREKNVELLIEAVQRLGAPYVLVLIGAGAGWPAEDRVISLPFEKDQRALAKALSSADAFVHANPNEPFGLVALEAMACGLPVVGVNSGGVSETVDDAVGRLAVRPDAAAYAEAVESLFADDVAALGLAARARAVDRFAWDRVFEDLSGLYAELSGRPAFADAGEAAPLH